MDQFPHESGQIRDLLRNAGQGMSITEIARALNRNNHSVGRYLDNLLVSGQVEMRTFGKAKVFTLSTRIPLDTIPDLIDCLFLVLDEDDRVVRVNPRFLEYFDQDRSDLIGKPLRALMPNEARIAAFLGGVQKALASFSYDAEVRIPADGESVFRQRIVPIVFEEGKKGMVILLENITIKKKSARQVRALKETFRRVCETIQEGVLILKNADISYLSSRAEEILGYTREELSAISLDMLADPDDREHVRDLLSARAGNSGLSTGIRFWITRNDRSRRFISTRIVRDRECGDDTCIIIITDLTKGKSPEGGS